MRVQRITVLLPGPVQVATGDTVQWCDASTGRVHQCNVVTTDEPVNAHLVYPETAA